MKELQPKHLLALEEEPLSDEEERQEPEPPKMSLAERMGYGVKGKQIVAALKPFSESTQPVESKWKKTVQQPKKKAGRTRVRLSE